MKELKNMNPFAAALALSLILAPAAYAADNAYQCPEKIEAATGTAKAPEGFTVWQNKQKMHYLGGITMYSGHPDEMASLVPDINKDTFSEWQLPPDKHGYWIACNYQNTTQSLIKKIKEGIKSCAILTSQEGNHTIRTYCK